MDSLALPTHGYLHAINRDESFKSIGWRFASNQIFCRAKLLEVLASFRAQRVKGVFITKVGANGIR